MCKMETVVASATGNLSCSDSSRRAAPHRRQQRNHTLAGISKLLGSLVLKVDQLQATMAALQLCHGTAGNAQVITGDLSPGRSCLAAELATAACSHVADGDEEPEPQPVMGLLDALLADAEAVAGAGVEVGGPGELFPTDTKSEVIEPEIIGGPGTFPTGTPSKIEPEIIGGPGTFPTGTPSKIDPEIIGGPGTFPTGTPSKQAHSHDSQWKTHWSHSWYRHHWVKGRSVWGGPAPTWWKRACDACEYGCDCCDCEQLNS